MPLLLVGMGAAVGRGRVQAGARPTGDSCDQKPSEMGRPEMGSCAILS